MVVSNKRTGLKVVDQAIGSGEVPIGVGPVPPAVEPDSADLAVVAAQLADLPLIIRDVPFPVPACVTAGGQTGLSERKVVGMVPVHQRIIDEERDLLFLAGQRERLDGIQAA